MSDVGSWIDIIDEIKAKTMANTKEILNRAVVIGFIQDINYMLKRDVIIPTDIIALIMLFCSGSTSTKIFIKQEGTAMGIVDIDAKRMSKLVEYSNSSQFEFTTHFSSGFCFVYNICLNAKLYDGVICVEQHYRPYTNCTDIDSCVSGFAVSEYPAIYLFESNKIEADIVDYYRFQSSTECWIESSFLFCGQYNGIIYESYGNLYQSKLENIDFETMNFNFDNIETYNIWQNNICNTFEMNGTQYRECGDWENYFKSLKPIKLRMIYLENQQKIFAMETEDDYNGRAEPKQHIKCGIFEFKQLKWHQIEYLIKEKATYCQRGICYDQYDKIYTVDDKGKVSEYNLSTNKWIIWKMRNSLKLTGNVVCWMNNNHFLCCSDGDYFGCLDIRENEKEWRKMHDIMNITNTYFDNDASNEYGPNRRIFM